MDEPIPTKPIRGIENEPILWRYFLDIAEERLHETQLTRSDYVVHAVMDVNSHIDGAFVASSGKNMGAFKGVGFPEEIGEFFRIDEYKGWTWTGHGRFPTNTPGWWGGAHPFALAGLLHRAQRRDQLLRHQPALPGDVRVPNARCRPTPRWSPTCSTSCSGGTDCPWR